MLGVLSPYHLTSREPTASAALLLSRRVVTLLPGPSGLGAPAGAATRGQVREAAARSPAYLRFMESWKWSMPLWNAGVIASGWGGEDPASDALAARARVREDRSLQALRAFVGPEPAAGEEGAADRGSGMKRAGAARDAGAREDGRARIDAERLSTDILKGGVDPTIGAPIAAGLDAFAARHGGSVFRPDPVSVAQRSEAALARRGFAFAAPVLLQAGAERVLAARDALRPALEGLWAALESAAGKGDGGSDARRGTEAAVAAYTREYLRLRPDLLREDPDGPRVTDAYVSFTLARLPVGAALRCAASAVAELARRTVRGAQGMGGGGVGGGGVGREQQTGECAAERLPEPEAAVACLFVRVTGARPEPSPISATQPHPPSAPVSPPSPRDSTPPPSAATPRSHVRPAGDT